MKQLNAETLIAACADHSFESGITIRATLEPLGGAGSPVKPAIYEGGVYQNDRRWHGTGPDRRTVDAIVIDNVPSQANRLEAALAQFRGELGLPELVLDLSEISQLPVHLPRLISSFSFPHRNGDAYLRDAMLDGTPFMRTPTGIAVFSASADNPAALFELMPQALLFGFWQSHLGKKRQQTKLARSWVSEIVGYEPATVDTRTFGVKGDPLNLSIDEAVSYDEDDQVPWSAEDTKKVGKRSKDSLAEIGHGQVPVTGPAGISFSEVLQQATVSFAGLRRIEAGTAESNATGRALLVSIGLAAHVAAFGRSFSLRSGCELRPVGQEWIWRGPTTDEQLEPLSFPEAVALVAACAARAEAAGLPVGTRWSPPVVLTPQAKLANVISKAWPVLDEDDV
jgi:CRISPR-associated protein Csb1